MYSTQCTVVMHVTKRASNFAFAFIVAAVAAEKDQVESKTTYLCFLQSIMFMDWIPIKNRST